MKMIEIKDGAKTTFKWVEDDYNPKNDTPEDSIQADLTTTWRSSISMVDIPKEKWDRIFSKTNHATQDEKNQK